MTYLLDTNVCIQYINGRDPAVRAKFLEVGDEAIATNSVTVAELYYGVARVSGRRGAKELTESFLNRFEILPFTRAAGELFGYRKRDLEVQGQMIGQFDLLIACIALDNDLTLVTHNTREFSRVEGLRLEDWEA